MLRAGGERSRSMARDPLTVERFERARRLLKPHGLRVTSKAGVFRVRNGSGEDRFETPSACALEGYALGMEESNGRK